MLRTMQKARYDENNLGHFGLAAKSYTHFTSPIRRYPDLDRPSHAARSPPRADGRRTAREQLADDMPEIARHTSERERRADDAERELVQWKKVRFMADKVGDEFEGYVTGVSAFGFYIELIEHFVEGMVHVSTMADDYYRFVEKAHLLKGENTGRVFRLGDKVTVQVIKVDMERRQIDLGRRRDPRPRARVGATPRAPRERAGAARARIVPRRHAQGEGKAPQASGPASAERHCARRER